MAARSSGESGKAGNPSKPVPKTASKSVTKPASRPVAKSSPKAVPSGARPPKTTGRFWSRGLQYGLVAALLLAPTLAFIIQAIRPPEEPPLVESQIRSRTLAPLIAGAIASPQAIGLEFSADEINEHVGQTLQTARRGNPRFSFQKVRLRMEPERCHLMAVYRMNIWSTNVDFHFRMTYFVAVQDGKLRTRPFSAQLGRVNLGAFGIRKIEEEWLRQLLVPFKRELILLNRLENLRLEPTRAILKVRPSSSTGSPL